MNSNVFALQYFDILVILRQEARAQCYGCEMLRSKSGQDSHRHALFSSRKILSEFSLLVSLSKCLIDYHWISFTVLSVLYF